MSREELIKEIDEQILKNRSCRIFSTCSAEASMSASNNRILGKVKTALKDADNEYERGVEEGVEICRNLYGKNDGPSKEDVMNYFGTFLFGDILARNTNREIIEKYRLYLSDKKKEEEKIVVGDVIYHEAWKDNPFVVTSIENGYIYGIDKNCATPKFVFPNNCIHKTGKHVDISGFLKDAVERK
jgi:hypothetical protein